MTISLALRVFLPFALGYFLSYLYRVVNAVIAPDLIADMGLDASTLGLLTAAYFFTFAAFQIPLGILLDHYGPRRIEAALLVFAALGAALFALAPNTPMLILARGLIGFGVSACLMAAFKAYVMWFAKERLALVNGFQMMAGGLGALAATQPVEALLGFTDWRGVFWILAGLTLVSATCVYFVVPDHSPLDQGGDRRPEAKLRDALAGVKMVFSSAQFWRVAPWCVLSQAVFTSVLGLWSGPWLRDVAGLDRAQAAGYLFWIAAAMVAGFFIWGLVAERLQRLFGVRPMTVAAFGMGGFMVVQSTLVSELILAHPALILSAWMAYAFFATAGILPYAALSQVFPTNLAGRVNTGLNLLVFVLAFVDQWAIGVVIDLWPQTASGGYAPAGYQVAFGVLLGLQVMALVWYGVRRSIRI
jgi:MFS family permease